MAVCEMLRIERPETVPEAAAQSLIGYIAANQLQPGDKLPSERELVQMLGVSRLPLREALCILKGVGVVEARHGKGVFVRPLDMAAVFGMLSPLLRTHANIDRAGIFEVRYHLESSIAELAADHRTQANLDVLGLELAAMERHGIDDRRAYMEHDMEFHRELARSTANPIFHVFMASITDLLFEIHASYQDNASLRTEAIGEHELILAAVAARNGEQASAAMRDHIRNAGGRL